MTKNTSDNTKELPNGWEWKKLGEVIKIKSGSFLPSKKFIEDGKYPVFGGNGENGRYDSFNLKGQNIVIGRVGALCGNVRFIDFPIWLTDNAFSISHFLYEVDLKFFTKLLFHINLNSYANQSAQPVISFKQIEEIPIPLPPLKEQERIVQKLDTAFQSLDEAITLQKENIAHTQELKKAVLVEQIANLDCEMKKLGEVANLITKGSSPKWQGVNYIEKSESSILFVTSENVGTYEILTKNLKYVEEKFNEIEPRSILKKGDILMNIVGASIGRTAMYNLDDIANINQAVCLIRLNEKLINKMFALHFFNSPMCIEFMFDKQVDNARANLSMGHIKDFQIPLPPLPEQEKIAAYLDMSFAKLDALIMEQEERLAQLMELKKSVLQEAFEGKL